MHSLLIAAIVTFVNTTHPAPDIKGYAVCDDAIQCADLINDHLGQQYPAEDGSIYVLTGGQVVVVPQ